MVVAKVRVRLKARRARNSPSERLDVEKLKDPWYRERYQTELQNRFAALAENEEAANINEVEWEQVKDVVMESARTTLGNAPRRRRNNWFDEECRRAAVFRREERIKWLADRQDVVKRDNFRYARASASRLNRRKKREAADAALRRIEQDRREGNIRSEFQGITNIRKGYQPRQGMVKDTDGNLIVDSVQAGRRWNEYFKDLLNRPAPQSPLEEQAGNEEGEDVDEPTLQEVVRVIESLKNNKAAGIDGMTAELIKYAGREVHEKIYNVVKKIWNEEVMPDEWRQGILIPLHKKGDRGLCENYRGICLLAVGYKIFAKVIYGRLNVHSEQLLGEYQAGFRASRSTIDQIFSIRQIMEKCWEYNKDTWHLFVDFKQAYDSIHRQSLWAILGDFNIPHKLIRLVKLCYNNTECRVRVGGEVTEPFQVEDGLKQGDPLATLLFNLALEWVMRQTPDTTGVKLDGRTYGRFGYADDMEFMAKTLRELDAMLLRFTPSAARVGLCLNVPKTKLMNGTRQGAAAQGNVLCGGVNLEVVNNFKYLGSILTSDNDMRVEVLARIASGARCSFSVKAIMNSRAISRGTKVQVYLSIIRPVVMYGSETWSLTKELERKLQVFENSILRRICGPVQDAGTNNWRRRHNAELREIVRIPTIVDAIASQRLRWAGHVARMDRERQTCEILRGKPEGRRPVGRPRMRWINNIESDLRTLGMVNPGDWWNVAQDRREWRRLVVAAKERSVP